MKCKNCKQKHEPFNSLDNWCKEIPCQTAKALHLLSKIKDKKEKQRVKDVQGLDNYKVEKKSKSQVLDLQKEINKLARKIDHKFYDTCIDCEREIKESDSHGAHRFNVGGHQNLRFNLNNIHTSTSYCNIYNTEHKVGYDKKLVERYSQEYYSQVHELYLKYKDLKLLSTEITKALKTTRKINRTFDKFIFTDSLDARNKCNILIGLYL
tara:strand:- start:88 stop:714 length:627 start_codon:yes stop_codon:yes gene_type:complete